MTKEIFISSTPHETRLAIVEDEQLVEIHYERENEYTLAGSMYKGKVTRVLPGMQSAFVDIGLERDAFLYVTDFLEDQDDSGEFERTALPAARPARAEQAVAAPAEADEGIEIPAATAEEGMEEEGGARRWKGRRGRRRGGKGREAGADAKPPADAAQITQGITLEINSDDIDESGWDAPQKPTRAPSVYQEESEAGEEIDFQREAVTLEEPSDDWISPEPLPFAQVTAADPEPEQERPRRGGRSRSHDEDESVPSGPVAFVLPGESLSKYGGQTSAPSSSVTPKNATVVTAKPSTMIETPITWDGGATLPGESLSRHNRGRKSEPAHVQPAKAEPIEDRPTEQQAVGHVELPPEPAVEEPEFQREVVTEGPDDFELTEEQVEESEADNHAQYAHAAHEDLEGEIEGEEFSSDAEASHKVDPNPPAEFRLRNLFGGKDKTEVPHDPHTGTTEQDKAVREQAHHLAHEFASKSEPTTEVFPGVPDFVEEEPAQDRRFEPGSGQVEEETIDEDEYDFEPLHAHGDEHDSEDLVEETLEHNLDGTDIGEFVRDTYVNERTTSFDSEDEEDEEDGDEELEDEASDGEEAVVADSAATPARQRRGRRGRRGQAATQTAAVAVERAPARSGEGERSGRQERGGRDGGRRGAGGPGHRRSAQTMSLPAITELLKPGQEILVQIAKEPIAKKGARITSHIALPGRFLVYMPTVNHVGVSRKIASDEERQRLKRVLLSEKADASGGFIVRTAAGSATEQELRADIRFLINLWTEIKQRSETAKPPSLIYHDLSLIERILRDQVTDKFSAIWVDTEAEYERVVKFLSRFQPSLVRHVKLYSKETPLFEQFGIQDEVNKALKSKVWLKSGGSIVINQTEALVAIDINTGKYVGKTARLEDTILKTNLDAIPEIVRQVRLRDLGGIIVIDFIDMDERRNRNKVMAALEEELKRDRAPSKVLQFNDFGLVAITRKRVKQSLERTLSMPCMTCQGTGMVKNPTTVCNEIYVELRKMHKHLDRGDVMLRVHPEVVKQLKTNGSRWLQDMEEMVGRTIIIRSDAAIHPEQFDIH